MKTKRKLFDLSVEFESQTDLIKCLEDIVKDLNKNQSNYSRKIINNCLIQWGVTHTEEVDLRVENINGVRCIILPSKINVK
jgi:hypothetical protein